MKLNDIATYLLENQFQDYEFVFIETNNSDDVTLNILISSQDRQVIVTTHVDFVF